jgi:hypothetical protein
MNIEIRLEGNQTEYKPGDRISGSAHWQLQEVAEAIELHLFYYTSGKGTQDVNVIETLAIASPPLSGSERFSWDLPKAPYSFSGKLISLIWAVEIVVLPGRDAASAEFHLTPTGKEILLYS